MELSSANQNGKLCIATAIQISYEILDIVPVGFKEVKISVEGDNGNDIRQYLDKVFFQISFKFEYFNKECECSSPPFVYYQDFVTLPEKITIHLTYINESNSKIELDLLRGIKQSGLIKDSKVFRFRHYPKTTEFLKKLLDGGGKLVQISEKEELSEAPDELEQTTDKLAEARDEVGEANSRMYKIGRQLTLTDDYNKLLNKKLDKANKVSSKAIKKLTEQLKAEKLYKEESIKRLKDLNENLVKEHRNKISILEEEVAEGQAINQTLEQVLDDKEAKIGNLHKKLNDLEQEVNDYKETETNLKFKIEIKNKRLEALEKLLTYADNRVHNLNNEIATKREFIKSNINTMVGQDRAGAYQVMPSTRLVNQNDYLEMEEKLAEYQNLNQALKCLLDVKDDQILNLEKKIENLVGQHDESLKTTAQKRAFEDTVDTAGPSNGNYSNVKKAKLTNEESMLKTNAEPVGFKEVKISVEGDNGNDIRQYLDKVFFQISFKFEYFNKECECSSPPFVYYQDFVTLPEKITIHLTYINESNSKIELDLLRGIKQSGLIKDSKVFRFRHYPKTTEFLKKLLDGGGKLVQISEKEELSEAPDELEQTTDKLAEARDEVGEANSRMYKIGRQLTLTDDYNKLLNKKLDKANKVSSKAIKKLTEQLKAEKLYKEESIKRLKDLNENLVKEHRNKISILEEEVAEGQAINQTLEQVLDDKEAKIGNLHKKLNDLEQEVNDYKETETNLKFKIEIKNKRLEALEKLLTYADNRVHNLNNEIATKREFIKSNINTMVGQDRAGAYQVMPSTRLVNQNDYLEMEEKLAEYQNLNQALKCLLDVKDDQILNLEKKIENLVGQHDESLKTTAQKRAFEDTVDTAGPSNGNYSNVKKAKLTNEESMLKTNAEVENKKSVM